MREPREVRAHRLVAAGREDRGERSDAPGERHQHEHAQPELGHRVHEQGESEGSVVDHRPSSPPAPDADETPMRIDAIVDVPTSRTVGQTLSLITVLTRRPVVGRTSHRSRAGACPHVPDELHGQRLVEAESLLLGRDVLRVVGAGAPQEEGRRIARHHAEQDEVEHQDEEQGEERLARPCRAGIRAFPPWTLPVVRARLGLFLLAERRRRTSTIAATMITRRSTMPIQAAAGIPSSVSALAAPAPTGWSVHQTALGPPQLSSGSPFGLGCGW